VSWASKFDRAITLPDGRLLKTLSDARDHILSLSKAEQKLPEWQLAAEMILMAAEQQVPVMFGNIAVGRAVYGAPKPPEPKGKRRDRPWMKRR
jgi:hypothetical protein